MEHLYENKRRFYILLGISFFVSVFLPILVSYASPYFYENSFVSLTNKVYKVYSEPLTFLMIILKMILVACGISILIYAAVKWPIKKAVVFALPLVLYNIIFITYNIIYFYYIVNTDFYTVAQNLQILWINVFFLLPVIYIFVIKSIAKNFKNDILKMTAIVFSITLLFTLTDLFHVMLMELNDRQHLNLVFGGVWNYFLYNLWIYIFMLGLIYIIYPFVSLIIRNLEKSKLSKIEPRDSISD
jgi:hypothetical protein